MHTKLAGSIILSLIILTSCQYLPWGKKEVNPIFVGEIETITIDLPEDTVNVTYRWNLIELPDGSTLVPDFNESSRVFSFIPDIVGNYAFAVTVVADGKEISDFTFNYTAMEDTSLVPRDVEAVMATVETTPTPSDTQRIQAPVTAAPPPAVPMIAEKSPPKPKPVKRRRAPVRKPAVKPLDPTRVIGEYTVQVSSWKNAKDAQKTQRQLAAAGYDAYIQLTTIGDSKETWWRVRIGNFSSPADAKKFREEIAATHPDAWVDYVRLDPPITN